jgi:hypothetical protein
MSLVVERPYRKNLDTKGLIYMGGCEYEITIKNLSITGALAEFHSSNYNSDIKELFNLLMVSTKHDLYLPDLHLAGEVEVVRVDSEGDFILLALEFKHVTYDIDSLLYKRKAYRKSVVDIGQMFLNGEFIDFTSVNVSVDGLMVKLNQKVEVAEGTVTAFVFERLGLEGEAKVVWLDHIDDSRTLIGLQYVNLTKNAIQGVPRFQ